LAPCTRILPPKFLSGAATNRQDQTKVIRTAVTEVWDQEDRSPLSRLCHATGAVICPRSALS
jgi:hypothetical protein